MSKRSRRKGPASRDERRATIKQKREILVTEEEWLTLAFKIERGQDHPLLVDGVPVTVLPRP